MISNDEYSKLLDQQFETKTNISANKIISGTILKINDQHVTVDIGYKSEGQIPREEFLNTGSSDDLKTGQTIEVFVEKLEDREGNVKVSHEKAIKMKSWEKLQKLYDNKERVKGFIVGKAKAGLYVKIMGTNAFLPLSQIDVRPVRDVSHLIKTEETFEILKMDYSKGNIVVSRKAILEEKQKAIPEIEKKCKEEDARFQEYKAKKEGEQLTGKFFSGKHWSSDWVAELNQEAKIKDPEELTYIKDEGEVSFELQTIEGETFTFPNERLEDKVVIIQIMGSWCPNCLDETHYYKSLYENYHHKGLEIISIGYETGDTFEEQSKSIARLKEKLVLDFIFLVGGKASKSLASDHFEMLNEVISFPTSIFIGRDGKVKRVHTGFNGPGTGVYYQEYIEKTNALIESLLAH